MILSLVGQKGGAGKSTLAIYMAAEWHRQGLRTLLVDGDPQGTAITWAAVAAEHGKDAPTTTSMGASMHRPGQLDEIAKRFDITVIDCPGRLGAVQKSALMISDVALLPCAPAPAEVWALEESLEMIREAQIYRPHLMSAVISVRGKERTRIARSGKAAFANIPEPVLNSKCGWRIAFQEAMAHGIGLTSHESEGDAAREIRELCAEVLAMRSRQLEVADSKERVNAPTGSDHRAA